MICLEVPRTESIDLPTLKMNLVAQGYLRVFAHGEMLRLEDDGWSLPEGESLLVIQDRVRLNEEQRNAVWRLWKRPCAWAAGWPTWSRAWTELGCRP